MSDIREQARLAAARVAVRVLPHGYVERYRRRRALRRYLSDLAYEIYDRQVRLELDDLEGRIAARRDGFYDRLVRDVLERTELIIQELDRRIEGISARHGNQLREVRADVEGLRSMMLEAADRAPGQGVAGALGAAHPIRTDAPIPTGAEL